MLPDTTATSVTHRHNRGCAVQTKKHSPKGIEMSWSASLAHRLTRVSSPFVLLGPICERAVGEWCLREPPRTYAQHPLIRCFEACSGRAWNKNAAAAQAGTRLYRTCVLEGMLFMKWGETAPDLDGDRRPHFLPGFGVLRTKWDSLIKISY